MSAEDTVLDDTQTVTVDSDTVTNESSNDDSAQETPEEKIDRLEKQNSKLFVRAKEAEGFKLVSGQWVKQPKPTTTVKPEAVPQVSLKDQVALVRANVHEDDLDDVTDYAKYKGISIAEALKSNVVQATLKDKVEQRKTAEATNTSVSKRTSPKMTDDNLLSKASQGDLPEKEEDIERLVNARIDAKRKK